MLTDIWDFFFCKSICGKTRIEKENESKFIDLLKSKLHDKCTHLDIVEAIELWKRKVIWTRPLTVDDAKA